MIWSDATADFKPGQFWMSEEDLLQYMKDQGEAV